MGGTSCPLLGKRPAVPCLPSTNSRATGLVRRVVLSQHLTKMHNACSQPLQETGLLLNGWYGCPHFEMPWWYSAYFALWGRPALLKISLTWYAHPDMQAEARTIAQRQGCAGKNDRPLGRLPQRAAEKNDFRGVGPFIITTRSCAINARCAYCASLSTATASVRVRSLGRPRVKRMVRLS